jgi:hypothetical protein
LEEKKTYGTVLNDLQTNQKSLIDALQKLASAITGGGKIGEVIEKLATALT